MKSIFDDKSVSINDKYSYTVTKDGLAYVWKKPEVKNFVFRSRFNLLYWCAAQTVLTRLPLRITMVLTSLALTQISSIVVWP